MADTTWFIEQDACGLASAISARAASASEAVEASLDRIAETDETLNACWIVLADEARAAARAADAALARGEQLGRLHGVPVIIKDAIWVRGVPATLGTRALADFVPSEDAVVVTRLRRAGAIIVAKSCNPEFLWEHQVQALHGMTFNPWCPARTASGSSGGSAAAVAVGMAPLALGSDAAGSIRSPASVCGVLGHKPTHGLLPRTPGFEEMRTTNVLGPLTRSVRDVALALTVLAGSDPSDDLRADAPPTDYIGELSSDISGLRIAVAPTLAGPQATEPSVAAVVDSAIERMTAAGWPLEFVAPELPDIATATPSILLAELGSVTDGREHELTAFGRRLVERSRALSAPAYYAAQLERARFTTAWERFFDSSYDVVLIPGAQGVAPPIEDDVDDRAGGPSAIANLTRGPAISVPIGLTDDGLPVGLEVMSKRGADATCLRVAAAIERLSPWPRLAPLARADSDGMKGG